MPKPDARGGVLVDANKNVTRWVRDIQGRVVSEVRANGKEYLHTYEPTTGRLKSVQDPKGQVKHYEYFLDGNLKSIQYKDSAGLPLSHTPPVSFTYRFEPHPAVEPHRRPGTTSYDYHPVLDPPHLLREGRDHPSRVQVGGVMPAVLAHPCCRGWELSTAGRAAGTRGADHPVLARLDQQHRGIYNV